ncbi:hypothetical protein EMCRGX_G006750 [Ephydatia muelleri]
MDSECSMDHLLDIALLAFDWKSVGRRLLNSEQNIEDISRNEPSEENRREKMLMMWRAQKGVVTKMVPRGGGSCNGAHRMIPEDPPGPLGEPSIALLMALPSRGGTINVIQRIGVNYSTFGIFLLNDDNGTLVDALKSEHLLNAENITTAILQRWLEGKGKTPVSWATLIGALRQATLNTLADQIEAATK